MICETGDHQRSGVIEQGEKMRSKANEEYTFETGWQHWCNFIIGYEKNGYQSEVFLYKCESKGI